MQTLENVYGRFLKYFFDTHIWTLLAWFDDLLFQSNFIDQGYAVYESSITKLTNGCGFGV